MNFIVYQNVLSRTKKNIHGDMLIFYVKNYKYYFCVDNFRYFSDQCEKNILLMETTNECGVVHVYV